MGKLNKSNHLNLPYRSMLIPKVLCPSIACSQIQTNMRGKRQTVKKVLTSFTNAEIQYENVVDHYIYSVLKEEYKS